VHGLLFQFGICFSAAWLKVDVSAKATWDNGLKVLKHLSK
jgi:hypothetical protein